MTKKEQLERELQFALSELKEAKSKAEKTVDLLVGSMLHDHCVACKFVDKDDEDPERCLYCGCDHCEYDGESSNFEMDEEAFAIAKDLIFEAVFDDEV